jgi:hypothetical protein
VVTVRLLVAMVLGALVAALGALFLGEYEFDEALPIAAGPLLAYIVAEIVVSVGRHRSPTLAVVLAAWSVTAVLLAGHLDANGVDPIKGGAYASAAAAGVVAFLRGNAWFAGRRRSRTPAVADGP